MAKNSRTSGHAPDVFFLAVVISLLVFGLAMLASASSDLGKTQFNNSYYYLEHQIAFGLTLKEVATQLGVTEKSIETYKARASEKLKLRSRANIVQYGVSQGWFRDALV